eukprot:3938521-Rhodomonas_salina.6
MERERSSISSMAVLPSSEAVMYPFMFVSWLKFSVSVSPAAKMESPVFPTSGLAANVNVTSEGPKSPVKIGLRSKQAPSDQSASRISEFGIEAALRQRVTSTFRSGCCEVEGFWIVITNSRSLVHLPV